jgi:N-acetylglucosamine-6-sulfatase
MSETKANWDQPGGASWIKRLAKLTDEVIEYNDDFYRARLQTLQAVDELVEGVVTRLEDAGILHNTYIFYTTDNGYHISQHRLNPGKECGFEEDINIPLIVRGPGVPVGESQVVTAQTDLAPTFLKIAGAKWGWDGLDGSPVPLNKKQLENAKKERQEHVNVEFWGRSIPEGKHRFSLDDGKIGMYFKYLIKSCKELTRVIAVDYGPNNTYKALRVVGPKYNLYYSVWCTNEHELYDLIVYGLHPKSNSVPLTQTRLILAN